MATVQNSISSNKPVITGNNNTAVGANAFTSSTSGNNNTAFGSSALFLSDGASGNTCIGNNAGGAIVSNGPNTAIGNNALASLSSSDGNVAIGSGSLSVATSGSDNISIGNNTLLLLDGGNRNVAIGGGTLGTNVSGNNNVAIGVNSLIVATGGNNVCVGYNAGYTLDSGVSNTCVGYQAGYNFAGAESNNIMISNMAVAADSNTIRIGTVGTQTSCFIAGIQGVSVTSAGTVVIDSSGQLGTTSGASIAWSVITADQTAAVNNGYICNKGSALLLALPTTSAAGNIIRVTGINTALGWKITQAAGQQIFFGTSSSTSGVTGFLQSSNIRDSIEMVCVVANLTWNVISSVGNITIS